MLLSTALYKQRVWGYRAWVFLCLILHFCPDQIGRNPGLQAIWEDEKQRRREKNQPSQIETPESQGTGIHHGKS